MDGSSSTTLQLHGGTFNLNNHLKFKHPSENKNTQMKETLKQVPLTSFVCSPRKLEAVSRRRSHKRSPTWLSPTMCRWVSCKVKASGTWWKSSPPTTKCTLIHVSFRMSIIFEVLIVFGIFYVKYEYEYLRSCCILQLRYRVFSHKLN